MYELALTKRAARQYAGAGRKLADRLNRCFDRLRQNPYEGHNISRLHGALEGYLRYRVGDWRVVYEVDDGTRTVVVLLIVHRSKAY